MSRKPRQISTNGIYHIILRAVNQQQLFEDNEDYMKCLFVLHDCQIAYKISIYAYCLMGNHIHLLLKCDDLDKLSRFFQSFGKQFVLWYNTKYQRVGYLFQDRYKSVVIDSDISFLTVINYIHQNPVKAKCALSAAEYRWSSCANYYRKSNSIIDLNTEMAIQIAGSLPSLHHFFAKVQTNNSFEKDNEAVEKARFLPDSEAKCIIKNISNCSNATEFQSLPKAIRNNCIIQFLMKGISITQISRLCGISRTTIYRIQNRKM